MTLVRRPLALLAMLWPALLWGAAAAAQTTPAPAWFPSQVSALWRWLDPRQAPFIPVPEIGTDPNSGTTFGILPVVLTTDEHQEITRIIAPDLVWNQFLGVGAHGRILAYPSEGTQWSVLGKLKQKAERGLDGQYLTGLTRREEWSFSLHFIYDRTATYRFFGLGNKTPQAAQSNYTADQVSAEAVVGWNWSPSLQLGLLLRPHFMQIEPGVLSGLPATNLAFPDLPGLGAQHEVLSRLFLAYDTRDSISLPTTGSQVVLSAGLADRSFLSSASYWTASLNARHYEPIDERRTLAGHVAMRYMPSGSSAPFWALSSLGGDRSIIAEEQPLRGFGEGRFVDRNLFAAGLELRSRVADLDLFSTRVSLQLAPFVDLGKVFHDATEWPLNHLHSAGGIGFRAVAHPFIVGYVDVGYGSEGTAIFSGIDYPF